MGRGPSPNYDDQRAQILSEAARLFAARGYPATSMSDLAAALGTSKATLYHYVRDKYELLVEICEGHVERLLALVAETQAMSLEPAARLRQLVLRFVAEYANAQDAHRVLTEDVKFLTESDRARVVAAERRVVNAFADALVAMHPGLSAAGLAKPLTMLLFGMINWMFTWLQPEGRLRHADMAPIVADMFFGGIEQVVRERLR